MNSRSSLTDLPVPQQQEWQVWSQKNKSLGFDGLTIKLIQASLNTVRMGVFICDDRIMVHQRNR